MASEMTIAVGDEVTVENSVEVPDGIYPVVEVAAKSSRMRVPGHRMSRVRVTAPTKRNRSWPAANWWIEDAAIVNIARQKQ